MVCYVLYHFFDWKGVSSGISTCMIAALSTAGSSRQKQILRFLGAIMGGLLFGILSQSVLLPGFDSIVGFTVLFAAVDSACVELDALDPHGVGHIATTEKKFA
jgi:multidrug resistance protein MdtO